MKVRLRKVTLQGRWPSKTVTLNDRFHCTIFVEQNSQQNDTKDLENRVIVLEFEMDIVQGDVTILYDDVEELQNQDSLTDLRLTTVEENDVVFEERLSSLEDTVNGKLERNYLTCV